MASNDVLKFGGTSMAQPELPAAIIEARNKPGVIVVSAPGKAPGVENKMTDQLNGYADAVFREDNPTALRLKSAILGRFEFLYEGLIGSKALRNITDYASYQLEPRSGLSEIESTAKYASIGERASARYFAELVNAQFVDSHFIRFNNDGQLSRDNTNLWLKALIQEGVFADDNVVVPGYYGYDSNGNVRLLPRGGSDRTGAIIANALSHTPGFNGIYENWTDKDGIYTVDPDIVPAARVIGELSREEVREGAHGGAAIMQGDAIVDLNGSNVVTVVRNTMNPTAPGTRIVPVRQHRSGQSVVAISGRKDLTEITVKDMGMASAPGYVATRLQRFGELALSFQHMPAAQDAFSITTVVETDEQRQAVEKFTDFARANLLTVQGNVEVSQKGVVYIVGEGLRDPRQRSQALIQVLETVAKDSQLRIEDTITNRNSPSVAFLVPPDHVEPIIQTIHRSIIEPTYS